MPPASAWPAAPGLGGLQRLARTGVLGVSGYSAPLPPGTSAKADAEDAEVRRSEGQGREAAAEAAGPPRAPATVPVSAATVSARAGEGSSLVRGRHLDSDVIFVMLTRGAAWKLLLVALWAAAVPARARHYPTPFYVPGMKPRSWAAGEAVHIMAGLVDSTRTQVPYEYGNFPFCKPPKGSGSADEAPDNLGGKLQGETEVATAFQVRMGEQQSCAEVCRVRMDRSQVKRLQKLIEQEYRVQLSLDSLPVVVRSEDSTWVMRGYPIGFQHFKTKVFYLFNHLRFQIFFHRDPSAFEGSRVVGFEVLPVTFDMGLAAAAREAAHSEDAAAPEAADAQEAPEAAAAASPLEAQRALSEEEGAGSAVDQYCVHGSLHNNPKTFKEFGIPEGEDSLEVVFSYEVQWLSSRVPWAERWDLYLSQRPDDEVHYFSIINSLLIVGFLTAVVAVIMQRSLRRDIAEYNREKQSPEERQDETGWKLLHGDVFRPPATSPMLLAVFAGGGSQVLLMGFSVIVLGLLGFLNPANKGGTLTAIIMFFVLSGCFAGYQSAQLYKFFRGKDWRRNIMLTAFLFPGTLLGLFAVLDMFLWGENAATAIGWQTALTMLALWLLVATPLVYFGAWVGFKRPTVEAPVRTKQIPRFIPEDCDMPLWRAGTLLSWYAHPVLSVMLSGVLPFGAVCIELFFIMSALWLHQYYYVFGFLFAVLCILVVTCAEIAIVMTYFQLCKEDYRWHWRSFLSCASSGLYLYAYSVWYYVFKLSLEKSVSTSVIYFTVMLIIALTFSLLCGAIGFYASFRFVRSIYGSIKVD